MRTPKCVDTNCRNNNHKAKSSFCRECRAENFRKFQIKKKIFNYGLYDKITHGQLFDIIYGYKLHLKPVSQQSFFRHVSFPYLKILLELGSDQNVNSFLKDNAKYTAFGGMLNKQWVIWLSFDSMNYMFVPEDFLFIRRRIHNAK